MTFRQFWRMLADMKRKKQPPSKRLKLKVARVIAIRKRVEALELEESRLLVSLGKYAFQNVMFGFHTNNQACAQMLRKAPFLKSLSRSHNGDPMDVYWDILNAGDRLDEVEGKTE